MQSDYALWRVKGLWFWYCNSQVHAVHRLRRFSSGNIDVKGAPSSGIPIIEHKHKIMKIMESDRYVSAIPSAQKLNIARKTILN